MRNKELVVAIAMLLAGIVYMGMSLRVPTRDGVDASSVPTILAAIMIALGLIELGAVMRKWWAPLQNTTVVLGDPAEPVAAGHGPLGDEAVRTEARAQAAISTVPRSDMATVGITLALIAGYIALLNSLSFPIATAAYLFVQFIVLTPRSIRPSMTIYALIAIIAAAVIFVAFRYGFGLLLPAGPLTPILP